MPNRYRAYMCNMNVCMCVRNVCMHACAQYEVSVKKLTTDVASSNNSRGHHQPANKPRIAISQQQQGSVQINSHPLWWKEFKTFFIFCHIPRSQARLRCLSAVLYSVLCLFWFPKHYEPLSFGDFLFLIPKTLSISTSFSCVFISLIPTTLLRMYIPYDLNNQPVRIPQPRARGWALRARGGLRPLPVPAGPPQRLDVPWLPLGTAECCQQT